MVIGEKIRELRKAKGLSQEKLAEKIGATINDISNWEREKYEPRVFFLVCLAEFFNISLDELCCRDFKGDAE